MNEFSTDARGSRSQYGTDMVPGAESLALVNLAAVSVENSHAHPVERPRDALAQGNRVRHRSRFALCLHARAQVPPLRQLIGIYTYRAFRQPVMGCIRAHLLGGGAMTTISENPALDRKGDRRRNVDLGDSDVSKQGAKTRSYAVSRAWDCREALWLRILAHSQPLPLPYRGDNRPMAFLRAGQAARDGRRDLLTGPRSRALEAASPTGARKEKAPRLAPVGLGGGAIGKNGLSPRPAGLVRSSRSREPRTLWA